jgi:hypothetical protein
MYVESKKVEVINIGSGMVVIRDSWRVRAEEMLVKRYKI